MNLAELKEAYKARKLALDSAKKEEEKYKALLKDAMLEAGESDYTDEAGYRFERIVQERKSMDEEKLLAELHERNLTSCIATKEVVDEDATLKAVEAGELPQEVLADALKVTEVVMIKLTDYPQVFYATKPEAKNTQALLDYMNSKTSVDPNVVALYTKMDKLCDGLSDEVVLKVTHGEHRVKRSWNKNFDYVVDVGIPKINPNYIGTYDTNLHEEMHFLDMLITVKDDKDKLPSKMFSQSYKPLVEAFDKATPVIGDKAKKLFEDFAKECDIIYKEKQETFDTQHEKLKEQYRSGAIDWKKYNSLFKKLQKEVNEEADNKRRALFGGGVSGLQDIYDAVSKGFRDTGQVTYGHGSAYYTDRRRTNPNCSESLANYASLCVGHPELIDILAEDYPEIVTALRGCVEAMLKEVPK